MVKKKETVGIGQPGPCHIVWGQRANGFKEGGGCVSITYHKGSGKRKPLLNTTVRRPSSPSGEWLLADKV